MFQLPDILIILAFFLVQWHITRLLLRSSAKRFSGNPLACAKAAIFLFDAILTFGYALTFSVFFNWLHLPGRFFPFVGAAALAYLLVATAAVILKALLHTLEKRVDPGRRRMLAIGGNTLLAAPALVLGYGTLIERVDCHVREVDIPMPGLDTDLDGLRILQVSDIHLSAFLNETEFARIIDQARELQPHLAVVTGDLISSHWDPLDACIRQLARLKSDSGIFGCMGNHERYADAEAHTQKTAARSGIRFLRSENQTLRFGKATLNLAGVDYQRQPKKTPYLKGAERLILPGATNILLSHNPDVFPVAANQGYNLVLAGHTHGGQITVEILDHSVNAARFFTPYVYGLYSSGQSAAYVTRGIGTIGLPARIGAPPEICILRLRKV